MMAVLQTRKLSNRTVAVLAVERDTVFWDRELPGFVMYDLIPLIYLRFIFSYFSRKRNASEFNQTPALAGASLT